MRPETAVVIPNRTGGIYAAPVTTALEGAQCLLRSLVFCPLSYYGFPMTLTIDIKDSGVLTLLRDMEQLDLLRVTTREKVSPSPARSKMTGTEELEYINRNAGRLNAEAEDVLSYQDQ
jgi:hypothetical protein